MKAIPQGMIGAPRSNGKKTSPWRRGDNLSSRCHVNVQMSRTHRLQVAHTDKRYESSSQGMIGAPRSNGKKISPWRRGNNLLSRCHVNVQMSRTHRQEVVHTDKRYESSSARHDRRSPFKWQEDIPVEKR